MKPLGILGGGQLARLMALKAHQLGIPVAVLSESADDPAAQVVSEWKRGRLDDRKALESFASNCSILTFESEFLNASLLEEISRQTQVAIYPHPRHMASIQDRLTQKRLLEKHKIASAPFLSVSNPNQAKHAFKNFEQAVVFKQRRFGYDGYGTFVVRNQRDLARFIEKIEKGPDCGFIAEAFVPFEREIAVMVLRSKNGQIIRLPFVETHQQNSRCVWVKGPLPKSARTERIAKQLERMLEKMNYVGILGVELFDTPAGLLVNELAPRVHNSAHHSLDSLSEDQFTLHIKAILGIKVSRPALLSPGFAMLNLLGESDTEPSWELAEDVAFHWYGKTTNRRGRKMGHLNVRGPTADQALALAKKRRKNFKL
jgi:5-(carboxyamino)imidazole ribonucleotide synthase